MNTAPAMSALNAGVPLPVPSAPAPNFGNGKQGTFHDLYQNLPAAQSQEDSGQQPADSRSLPQKKKAPGEDQNPAPATSQISSNVVPANAPPLTLTLALGAEAVAAQLQTPHGEERETIQTPQSEPQPAPSPKTNMLMAALISAGSAKVAPQLKAGLQDENATPQAQPEPGNQQNGVPMADSASTTSFPLSAANLAFSLQLANTRQETAATTRETLPASALPATAEDPSIREANVLRAALPANVIPPKPAIPELKTTSSPSVATSSASPRSSTGSPQSSATQRAPREIVKSDQADQDTSARNSVSNNSQRGVPAGAETEPARSLPQALPDTAAWLGASTRIETRTQGNMADPPAAPRPTVTAQLQEVQPLIAETPRTNPSTEILLHLGNGQTSAAVRVMDRGGAVNVSVHAPDQELRTSLRSNLTDLTSQLNAQGLKTEGIRTGSSQASSENRQEQSGSEQRSPGHQQQSHNDRQSQRDRRPNGRWMAEFEEQTSNQTGNPRGNNS